MINFFLDYLATATMFSKSKKITNTFIQNDVELITQFNGGAVINEKADILCSEIADKKIVTPYVYSGTVIVGYAEFVTLLNNLDTFDGFIRIVDNNLKVVKIYPTKLTYQWSTNELKYIGDEKWIGDYIEISELVTIGNFRVNNGYVMLYDVNNLLIESPTRFTKFSINGVNYVDLVQFEDALILFLN